MALYAESKVSNLAIIPLHPFDVTESQAQTITGLLEVSLAKTGVFHIIEQEEMLQLATARQISLQDCTDEQCAVKLGKILAAEQIVISGLLHQDNTYVMLTKMIHVGSGECVSREQLTADSIIGLIGKIDRLAYQLALTNLKLERATQPFDPEKQQKRKLLLHEKARRVKFRKIKSIVLPTSVCISLTGLALSGFYWYLSDLTYDRYLNATITSVAEQERNNVRLYDGIKWTSTGSTIFFLGVTLFFSFSNTSTKVIDRELRELELKNE